jgi:hypothetical protein
MSNNAVYGGDPYHVVEVEGHEIELKPVEEARGRPQRADVMASTLVIGPDRRSMGRCPPTDLTSLGARPPRRGNQPLMASQRTNTPIDLAMMAAYDGRP